MVFGLQNVSIFWRVRNESVSTGIENLIIIRKKKQGLFQRIKMASTVQFSMDIRNVDLMYECGPQHWCVITARMKQDWDRNETAEKIIGVKYKAQDYFSQGNIAQQSSQ